MTTHIQRLLTLIACKLLILLIVFSEVAAVTAAPVTVQNFGFENSLNFWTHNYSNGDAANTWNASVGLPGPPEGSNVAFINSGAGATPVPFYGEMHQVLGDTLLANTTYTLDVEVGRRSDGVSADPFTYEIRLKAGGTVVDSLSIPAPTPGTFETATLVFSTGASHPQLGQPLRIDLSFTGTSSNSQVHFDHVRLDASPAAVIPEPGTLALSILGLAGFGVVGWRRRHSSRLAPRDECSSRGSRWLLTSHGEEGRMRDQS